MVTVLGKPDLLDILQRRRRTVASYLEGFGVKTTRDLEALISVVSKEYSIVPEFLTQAKACVVEEPKKQVKVFKEPKEEMVSLEPQLPTVEEKPVTKTTTIRKKRVKATKS